MPCIVYGGVKYSQVRHAALCKKCLDTVESKDDHDLVYCSCGSVGLDGGISDGNRSLGDPSHRESRAVYCAYLGTKRIWLPEGPYI